MSKCLHTRIYLTVLYLVSVLLLTIEGSCPTGHYCPTEGGQIPCPRGFINPNTDSTDWTACQPCPGGQYCATEGLTAPSGNCTAGYFCSGADITPTPISKRCWPRYFCPAGSSEPDTCPSNTYNYDYGQTECHECPVGHFCIGGELIGKCYEGYHCLAKAFVANQTACTPGTYCTDGLREYCPQGTIQPYESMNECQPCPVGKYCNARGLTTYTGPCSNGWWCGLGSSVSQPEGQSCPPGHRCTGGFKIACGAGSYQPDPGQQDCILCPAGFYCGLEATVSPTPCAQGQCCHDGFIEPTSCHQGDFLHLTYEAASRPSFAEANALCVAQGQYQLAVIDTSEEFDRLMAWFLDTSTYVTGGTLNLPDGVWLGAYWDASTNYKWNMCFDSVTLTWGDWATGQDATPNTEHCLILNQDKKFENVNCGDPHDILCETCSDCDAGNYYNNDAGACEPCPSGMYCSRKGLLAPSGSCADTFHCSQGGAFSPHQEPCSPGSYCSGGFQTECPAGFYQPNTGSWECLLCSAGHFCIETGLQYPNGLCHPGYYCPAGTIDTYDEGIICPIGHSCPAGSGAPVPCESGRFQENEGMGYCFLCGEYTYCNQDEAIAEKQSGPDSPTHGVVVPKVCQPLVDCQGGNTFSLTFEAGPGGHYLATIDCDWDPYVPGVLNLELSCTPPCDGGAVSSQEGLVFTLSCPTCLAAMTSITWSIRQCYIPALFQCHMCYRRIKYIDNHNAASFTYNKKWSRFDTTGWKYFSTFVKVETSDGQEGMAYSGIYSFFDPYTGPVNCIVTPDNGQPMDTMFSINCDEVPGQTGLTLMYYLSVYDVEIFQGTTAMTGLQLQEARPEDNFDLPLHLVTRSDTHLFYETDFTVKIYPPVDGALTDWSAWGGCSVSCGPGSWSRSRSCTNPAPAYGGADCVGDMSQTADCNEAVCPIDGGYTAWTSWSSCTLTCGTGSQSRSRDCTNPVPQYGGADCVGEPTATQDCNIDPCPIDGGLTEWSAWNGCTKSCGSGTQTRTRDCTDPPPQYGGADCIGSLSDSQACNTQPCPIDGGYTIWTGWGTCSLTCGTGSQSRSRDCTNPVPQYGGADCVGEPTATQDCNIDPCPIDGGLTEWSSWNGCTKSCGSGTQTRTRDCTDPPPQYGGADCIGSLSDSQACNTQSCPIDGGYTIWTGWGTCSLTCGTGSQSRSRDCTNPFPQYGGADCIGSLSDSQTCSTQPCPIDGGYTIWTGWGTCSLTCGTGSHSRSRDCTDPIPQHGGAYCVGDSTQSQDCMLTTCAVNGQYSDWSLWDTCTKSCGTGSQTRTRSCDDPAPQHGGLDCVGSPTDIQNCNIDPCPIDGGLTEWGSWGTCTQTCGTGSRTRSRDCTNPTPQYGGALCIGDTLDSEDCNSNLCPVDGALTDWSAWGGCSVSCGPGSWSRSRSCTNPAPAYGGADCVGDMSQTADCNEAVCPIDGGYTAWTSWSSCTLTCGTGSQSRSRDCTNPVPQYGGADCVGEPTATQDCNIDPCPIDGGLTEWSSWNGCTKSCGSGNQTRTRDCTDPPPQYGGADCIGSLSDSQTCNTQPCPIDGGYTIWTGWGTCSLTCGTGSQSRSRDCTNPVPQYGGADCMGEPTATQDCNIDPCPIDGGYTIWTGWGTCSLTCGTGSQSRSRDCTNPFPQYGGADCIGSLSDSQTCSTQPCPIDGGYTIWTGWGTCSLTCGTGSHSRSRDCTDPIPQHGGAYCVGDSTQSQDCMLTTCAVNGQYSDWSPWDTCTKSCGTGSQTRTRACDDPAPQHGGLDCVGSPTDIQNCNIDPCPIDGGLTEWGSWGACTQTCGTGSRTRSRDCTNPTPQYGGALCIGDTLDSEDCNSNLCPGDEAFSDWSAWSACSASCGLGSWSRSRVCTNEGAGCIGDTSQTAVCNVAECPIDGGYTAWTSWSSCTLTCGSGSQSRSRDCTNPVPQYGGADCVGEPTATQDCNIDPCPIDGGLTEWSAWNGCTKSCDSGTQTRTRDCTDPPPQYGGADCIGSLSDSQACNTQPCPIDGGYTIWTGWGTCSLTCGTGSQSRSRDCTNPIPQHGGAYCVGDSTQSQDCILTICAVNGQYSDWSVWDACTKSCGMGSQTRTRTCDDPAPQHGGLDCVGSPTDIQNCNIDPCPIDGGLTEWGSWGACTQTCGTGSRTRSRDCTNPTPQYGGALCIGDTLDSEDCNSNLCSGDEAFSDWSAWSACSASCGLGSWSRSRVCTNEGAGCVGDTSQTADCNVAECPIDGGYTAWTSWSSCTLTCGTGSQSRSRDCTNPIPQHGGAYCVGDSTQSQDCMVTTCAVNGQYSDWSVWDACTKSCGTGSQTRTRTCDDPAPQHGGLDCVGSPTDTQNCNIDPCPIDGGLTEWGSWGACTQTCGTGSRTRSRDCTNPTPQYGGALCIGDTLDSEDCNSNLCPGDEAFSDWSAWSACSESCGLGSWSRSRVCTNEGAGCVGDTSQTADCNVAECPIDGGYTAWTSWSSCTLTCGMGSQSRSRDCTNPVPQYGGADCVGEPTATQDCNIDPCPIDGGLTEWSAWNGCTKSCGSGTQTRTRDCTDPPPQYGGADCIGSLSDSQACNKQSCPIDGGYTIWTGWGTCSLTCGTGSQSRSRDCTNPIPQHGGADCVGDSTQSQNCVLNTCAVDGLFSDWSPWDTCTKSCDMGSQTRTRTCDDPAPQNGGLNCVGSPTDIQNCNIDPCPIDGGYTIWSSWSMCSMTCGTASQSRSRDCTDPIPQYGGADCVGDPSQSQDCVLNICAVDGLFSDWSVWDTCTKSCGTGNQTRTRACDDPAPQHGGADCIGSHTEIQNCNIDPCPIDGGFTEWGSWGPCTQTCGTGSRTRSRDCTNPTPQYGGADCIGDTLDSEDCNSNLCPVYDSYDPGVVKVTFSCLPKCTSLMSSAVDILIGMECDACRTSTVKYTWTLRRCVTYSVDSCDDSSAKIYYINNSSNTYTYHPAELASLVSGWPHLGMFLKAELDNGNSGMTYHIWKFFDPAASPPSCNTVPPSGLCISTQFSVTCEDVSISEVVNISYSLYKDHSLLVLLYKGDTPNATDLLLPAGFQDGQNNLHLCMVARIQGHRFYLAQTIVQVTCESLSLEEIMGGKTGDSPSSGETGTSAIDQQILEGDIYGAIQKLEIVVNIMNLQTNGTQEGNTNTTTPVDNGEPEHQNETHTIQQLMEYRTQVTKSIAKINISDHYHLVSTVCTVLNEVTEKKEQLSEEAKEVATGTYSQLAEGLVVSLATTEEEISIDEITSTAQAILQGTGAMIGVLTDSLEAVFTQEGSVDTGVDTTPKSTTVSQNTTRKIEMTGTLLKSVESVCNALLDKQIQDVQETIIETEQVQVAVRKVSPSKLRGLKIELESPMPFTEGVKKVSTVMIPDDIVVPVETSNVRLHIVVLERNPFLWSNVTESIRTPVVSVTLKDSDQNVVNIENLQHPIKLLVPTDIDSTKAAGHLRLKVSVYKDTDGLSLLSDKSYSSKASFRLLKSDKIAGLKFTLPTNLTSLRLYISNKGAPEFQDIMQEGKLYPQEVISFLEEFSGYLASNVTISSSDDTNRSVIHFAGRDKTQGVSESYVGVSLDLSNNDTVMVVRDLDAECLGNETVAACEGRLEMEVEFRTFTMQCMYWLEESQAWSGSGCWLSADTTDTILGCECDHLSVFGGSIQVAPFEIDALYDLMLLDTFFDNPVVITVVIIIWVIYMFLVLWAIRADRRDREKDGVILCGGSNKQAMQEYLVCVMTGWWNEAGTTANVFFYIKGTLGRSPRVRLTSNRECLQTGCEDWFLIKTEHSLGNLRAVSLWHDNSGTSPHWFLNQVFVKDVHRGDSWMFLFHDWLALDRGDLRLTSITLDTITEEELLYRQKQHFFVKTMEDLRDRHIWLSIFSKPARSSFSRVQRLTCCLSILLTMMLADLILCGIPTDDPNDQVSAEAFNLSGSQFAIGIQSSLMVFPINMIIIQVFLQSKPSPPPKHAHSSTLKYCSKFCAPKDHRKSLRDMRWYKRVWNFPLIKSRWGTPSDWSSEWSGEQSQYFSCHASLGTLLDDLAGSENEQWFVDSDSDLMEDYSVTSTSGSDVSMADCSIVKRIFLDTDWRRSLPHWCVYIAWAVVMTLCVLCSYLVMLYGLKYGYTRSVEWLVALVIGFFCSTLIQEPVKAVAVAVLLTFILKKTVQFQDVEPKIEHGREVEFETIMSSQDPKHSYLDPLSKKLWRKIRPILELEWMMDLTMKNLAVQAVYVTILLVIINSHRPVDTAYMSAVAIRNLYVDNNDHMQLAQVKTSGTFYRYLHETLVPGMEAVAHGDKRKATLGSNHYLIGSYRLRQLRVKRDTSCHCVIKQLMPEGCDAGCGTSQQDTHNYNVGWVPASSSLNATWPYSRASMLNTLSFPGQFATYPGSGYVVNIPVKSMEKGEIIDMFSSLEESGWFDVRTRAVFVEFSLYNPNVDLFHVVVILFENLGSVSPINHIYTNSIFQYRDGSKQLIVFCEVLFVLLNMMFAYIQLIKLFRDGRKKHFSDVWNVVELIQISLSFATVGVSSHRYATVLRVLSEIKKQDGETYINMYPLVFTDLVFEYVNASLLILLMFKAIRLLQLHPRLRIIARTLSSARSELLHFSFIFFVVFLAYSHTSFLFFHKVLHHYRAFGSTFVANVGLLLGNGEIADMAENYNFLGPLFIVMFAVSLNFCLVTMYAAILNIGRMYVRDKKRNKNEMHLNDCITNRVKRILDLE